MKNEEAKALVDSIGKAVVPDWDETCPVTTTAKFLMDKDGNMFAEGEAQFWTLDGKVFVIAWTFKDEQIDVRPKGSYIPAQRT